MVTTRLDKSQRRPKFPFAGERVEPSLPDAPAPRRLAPVTTPEARALAEKITSHLLAVRDGLTTDRTFMKVVVLDRVTVENGTRFYHLSDEARNALIDGLGLPWGPR